MLYCSLNTDLTVSLIYRIFTRQKAVYLYLHIRKDLIMKIEKYPEGSRLTIKIIGRLDALTAPEFNRVIESSLGGVTELVLDLKQLEYTSSAGLREFLGAQEIMDEQGSMIVKNANESVMDIFTETGFNDILDIE